MHCKGFNIKLIIYLNKCFALQFKALYYVENDVLERK